MILIAKNVGAGFHPCPKGVLQRMIKRYFRYAKIIFNKKILIIFTILATIFSIYTIILNKQYENFCKTVEENIEIEAVIISSPKESEYYNSYTVKGKTEEFKNKKFILYVKKGTTLEYGDKIKITGEFYEPEDIRNYKGFSYKKYLQTEKIYGTIKAKKVEIESKNNTAIIFELSNITRNKIIEQIKNILPEETGGLLIGLMIGDKTYISDELRLDFQKSSLAHILAVSGAHVSYIILGLTYLVSINKMPKKSGYIFIICVLIVFIFITNFSVSVIRACIMSIILIISKIFHRKSDIKNTIAISVLIILVFNPYSINSVSMQLSYLGTIGVIFVAPVIEKFLGNILRKCPTPTRLGGLQRTLKIISVPIAAQITILPVMIKNFNTISLTFLISNLIAMPLLGICIIGGYLLTIFSFIWLGLAQKIGIIFNIILKALILIARFCGNLKLSNIYVVTPSTVTMIIYYVVIWGIVYFTNLGGQINYCQNLRFCHNNYMLCRRPPLHIKKILKFLQKINYKKIVLLVFVLIIIIEIPYSNYNGKLKIYFIDVGQRR